MNRHAGRAVAFLLAVPAAVAASALADSAFFVTHARLSFAREFGHGGWVTSIAAGDLRFNILHDVKTDSAGRIVVAGSMLVPGTQEGDRDVAPVVAPLIARLLPNGELDATFGDRGIATVDLRARVRGLAIDGQDRPVFVYRLHRGPFDIIGPAMSGAVRLGTDGRPDETFGDRGIARFDGTGFADGGLVCANPVDSSLFFSAFSGERSGLVRLLSDGTFDTSYGDDGFAAATSSPTSLVADAEGRAVVGTASFVLRFDSKGKADAGFGEGGFLRSPSRFNVRPDRGCVEIDPLGRIVVLGTEDDRRGVFRFLPSGELDGFFCDGGVSEISLGLPGDSSVIETSLALSRAAEGPYVLHAGLGFWDLRTGRTTGSGNVWRKLDPREPAAIESIVERHPLVNRGRASRTKLPGIAVSPDGRTAYAAGDTHWQDASGRIVRRGDAILRAIDLTRSKRLPLPEFRIAWEGPIEFRTDGSQTIASGRLRVTNDGDAHVRTAPITLRISDDALPGQGDEQIRVISSGTLPPHSEKIIELADFFTTTEPSALRARRFLATVDEKGLMAEADRTDNVAVSAPIP